VKLHPIVGGLVGLGVVVLFSLVARLTFLGGSLFDPAVAPGLGPFALGDLLAVAAFAGGFLLFRMRQRA
jgi:hypothetical protein